MGADRHERSFRLRRDVVLNFYATNLPGNVYNVGLRDGPGRRHARQYADRSRCCRRRRAGPRRRFAARVATRRASFEFRFASSSDRVRCAGVRLSDGAGFARLLARTRPASRNLRISASSRSGSRRAAIVLVQHLSDGAPVAGAGVTRLSQRRGYKRHAAARARTVRPAPAASSTCTGSTSSAVPPGSQPNTGPQLGVIVTEGSDVATLTTRSYERHLPLQRQRRLAERRASLARHDLHRSSDVSARRTRRDHRHRVLRERQPRRRRPQCRLQA